MCVCVYIYVCVCVCVCVCVKSSFARTDNNFQKSRFFIVCIPNNLNQTAVGLFWIG